MASQKASAGWVGWIVGICALFLCSFTVSSFIVSLQQIPEEHVSAESCGALDSVIRHPLSDSDRVLFLSQLKPEDAKTWSFFYGKSDQDWSEEAEDDAVPIVTKFKNLDGTLYAVTVGYHELYGGNYSTDFWISATSPKGDEYKIESLVSGENKLWHRVHVENYYVGHYGKTVGWKLVHENSALITSQIRSAVRNYIAVNS